jgi:hypothetical protein
MCNFQTSIVNIQLGSVVWCGGASFRWVGSNVLLIEEGVAPVGPDAFHTDRMSLTEGGMYQPSWGHRR